MRGSVCRQSGRAAAQRLLGDPPSHRSPTVVQDPRASPSSPPCLHLPTPTPRCLHLTLHPLGFNSRHTHLHSSPSLPSLPSPLCPSSPACPSLQPVSAAHQPPLHLPPPPPPIPCPPPAAGCEGRLRRPPLPGGGLPGLRRRLRCDRWVPRMQHAACSMQHGRSGPHARAEVPLCWDAPERRCCAASSSDRPPTNTRNSPHPTPHHSCTDFWAACGGDAQREKQQGELAPGAAPRRGGSTQAAQLHLRAARVSLHARPLSLPCRKPSPCPAPPCPAPPQSHQS